MNAYPRGEKFYTQSARIAEELKNLGVETDILKNGEIDFQIDGEGRVRCPEAKEYDFCVYLDKDKYLGYALERCGLRLFNRAGQIERCDDKMTTYLALVGSGIPTVPTISAPLCYTPGVKPDSAFLKKLVLKLGFPMVVKTSYGSLGNGVHLVHGMHELQEISEKFLYLPHLYQKFIDSSEGQDIRIIVIGGKAVGAIKRQAQAGEFRSNVELGGKAVKIEPPPKYIALAEKAAQTLELDYCGVDLLETEKGPIVCEVNSNAFFEGFERATGLNIARFYAKHILSSLES